MVILTWFLIHIVPWLHTIAMVTPYPFAAACYAAYAYEPMTHSMAYACRMPTPPLLPMPVTYAAYLHADAYYAYD